MTDAIRLYVVTDRPDMAARYLMGCSTAGIPAWLLILSDIVAVEALPSGVAALGLFFPSDFRQPSLVETIWRERIMRGGIDNDRGKHMTKLDEWLDRRAASEREHIAEYLAAYQAATAPDARCA